MPTGIYIRTKEMRKNNSKAQKGKLLSEETKRKMSIAHTGKHLSKETKQRISKSRLGISPWNKGKLSVYSIDTKLKMSEAAKGNKRSQGHHHTEASKEKMSEAQKKIKKQMFAKMKKTERRKYCEAWILAGQVASQTLEVKQKRNKTIRENFAKMTKKKKREHLEPWIKAGHKASHKANPSAIEKLIWGELDKMKIDYQSKFHLIAMNSLWIFIFLPKS